MNPAEIIVHEMKGKPFALRNPKLQSEPMAKSLAPFKRERKREREDERFDKNEMARRLSQNKEETLTTEAKIKEARQKLSRAEEARQNDDLYRR